MSKRSTLPRRVRAKEKAKQGQWTQEAFTETSQRERENAGSNRQPWPQPEEFRRAIEKPKGSRLAETLCNQYTFRTQLSLMHSVPRALERNIYTCTAQVCATCLRAHLKRVVSLPSSSHGIRSTTLDFHTPHFNLIFKFFLNSERDSTLRNSTSPTEWRFGGTPHLHRL